MARTYTLDPDRKFTGTRPKSGEPPPSGLSSGDELEDEIPMGRVIGGELSWTHIEQGRPCGTRKGIIRALDRGVALIQSGEEWYQESNNGIHLLSENLRCPHCGEFLCQCNPTHHQIVTMSTLTFEQLALLPHKTPIAAVEGTLISLTQPKNYASGANAGKPFQYGTIKSGDLKHDVKFDGGDATVQPQTRKGQFIRIESHNSGKGLTGVYMDENEYPPGTIKRAIRCTATAVITYPQAGNSPQTPQAASHPPSATQTPPARQDAPQRVPGGNTGHPAESTVEERVGAWLRIAEEVCRQISKPFEGFMEGLSSTDIKEITTGISMSYKGQYGVYAPPVFDSQKGDGRLPEDSPAPRSALPSWRDFVNVKSKKKLGDYDEPTFLKLAEWAYTAKLAPDAVEAQRLAANVRMGVVEKKIARNVFLSLFSQTPGYGTEFDEQDLETVCGEQMGKASTNLTIGEWEQSLDQLQAIIADCKTAHNNDGGIPF